MRIIVTGGSGRLGRSVVDGLLAHGHDVLSLDRGSGRDLPGRHAVLDLADSPAVTALFAAEAPDAVVHLAAIAVPFSAPERDILTTNTSLTWTVLEAAVAAGTRRVLVSSSPTVMGYGVPGWSPASLPFDESHPVAPWNAYNLSKVVMEQTVAAFVRAHGTTTRFGVFRPCFVISPEEWRGAPTQQGHTVQERLADPALAAVSLFNYVDSRDAADFVGAWLDHAETVPNGSCFFVGAGDALATAPIAELAPRYAPAAASAAAALTGTRPAFSTARAAELLGWVPQRSWRTELPAEVLAALTPASAHA